MLLLDVADSCDAGGTQDSVVVLGEVLAQGLQNVCMAPLYDPQAVQIMLDAGVGAQLEVDLGGKTVTPALAAKPVSLRLHGEVCAVHDEPLTVTGPVFTDMTVDPGAYVLFRSGPVEIVVTSRRLESYSSAIFRRVGVDPASKRFLILKSRSQCTPSFLPTSAGFIECNGSGVTTSDLRQLHYERLRRPIFPLDEGVVWTPTVE
jgi:microcystin degradation protein MlrC